MKTFLPPLVGAFFVTWFVFIMQYLWLYIDDFVGKGLEPMLILEMLGLQSLTLVTIALPLGILFAAIMSFGNIGESYELVAIKSSGISVFKLATPLIFFICCLTVLTFLFNDNIIPQAQIKAYKLYHEIANKKPAVNIKEGIFYKDIPGHTIYVGKKGNDNKSIHDIKIYDHSQGDGNDKVVLAEHGSMMVTKDKRFLIFELRDGWRYEDRDEKRENTNEQIRLGFKYWKKVFDLSDFKMPESKEDYFKSLNKVMPLRQIITEIDTTEKKLNTYVNNLNNKVYEYLNGFDKSIKKAKSTDSTKFLDRFNDEERYRVLSTAEINARSVKNSIEIDTQNMKLQKMHFVQHKIEFHRRFTLPFACLVLFIIGTSLGSIIRKGGLGWPFVLAVIFFVIYHVLNTVGEKLAGEMVIPPWLGMWMSTIILSILGIFLMKQANIDSPYLNAEWLRRKFKFLSPLGILIRPIKKFFNKLF